MKNMKKWFLCIGLALFVGAFVNCGVAEGTAKFFSPGFKLWGSYHWLSMSDWNSYKESMDDWGYPYFHHGFVLGGEFSCLFMDMWGFGLETGLISGKGIHFDDTYCGHNRELSYRIEYGFKHSAKAFPLLFTLYFTPRVSLFRFVLGGGAGFYHARTNFDYKYTYCEDYYEDPYDGGCSSNNYYYYLSSNGLGIHGSAGLEIKIPATPISIFAEGKLRHAKISGFKGKLGSEDVKLVYAKHEEYDDYFGPMIGKMEGYEVRDGIIDFSGFEFAIGISFRF